MAYVEVALLGWMPGADPTVPGVITDCNRIEPTVRGLRAANELSTAAESTAALTTYVVGVHLHKSVVLGDGQHLLAATAESKIVRLNWSTNVWDDISRTSGYVAATLQQPWRFATYGDAVLAVQGNTTAQYSTAGYTQFADIAGGPAAQLICVASNFAVVADVAMTVYGGDVIQCSALGDPTDWTPSVATQAATFQLVETPGVIQALHNHYGNVIVWKRTSMYVGRYVGPPVIWSWNLIASDIGAVSQECVVNADGIFFWWDHNGCYMFDGSRPIRITSAPVDWLRDNMQFEYDYKMVGQYDLDRRVIRWWFSYDPVYANLTYRNRGIAYHPETGRWGRNDRDVELPCAIPTYGSTKQVRAGVFDTSHRLMDFSGTAVTASITTGDLGGLSTVSTLRSLRPKFFDSPDAAVATHMFRDDLGTAVATASSVAIAAGKFDLSQQSRWHRVRIDTTGDMEIGGFAVDMEPGGAR